VRDFVQPPPDPPWLAIARAEIGIKERAGAADHPRVLEYLRTTSLPPARHKDETPWCSAFVNWVMQQAGYRGTGRANARSWLKWGQSLAQPRPGCIVVFWRGTPKSAQGHVAFWLGTEGSKVIVLGGNQVNAVCSWPYPRARVIGYRWPPDADQVPA